MQQKGKNMSEMKSYTLQEYADILKENNLLVKCELCGREEQKAESLTFNSKEAVKGTLFVCKGAAFKEDYLADALKSGAICYISEKKYPA